MLSLSPGLGPDGLPSPASAASGAAAAAGYLSAGGGGSSCNGSPPPPLAAVAAAVGLTAQAGVTKKITKMFYGPDLCLVRSVKVAVGTSKDLLILLVLDASKPTMMN